MKLCFYSMAFGSLWQNRAMRDLTWPIVLIERRDGTRGWFRPPADGSWAIDMSPEYEEEWTDPWKRPPMRATGNVELTVTCRYANRYGYTVDAYGRLSQETTPRGRALWRITEPRLGQHRAD
jgi:hypothetical protein